MKRVKKLAKKHTSTVLSHVPKGAWIKFSREALVGEVSSAYTAGYWQAIEDAATLANKLRKEGWTGPIGPEIFARAIRRTPMQAGRELDALIAEKVMGFVLCRCTEEAKEEKRSAFLALFDKDTFGPPRPTVGHTSSNGECNWCGHMTPARYSTDIVAAREVFNKVLSSRLYEGHISSSNGGTTWCCCFTTRKTVIDWADTAPLAICLAALKTVR